MELIISQENEDIFFTKKIATGYSAIEKLLGKSDLKQTYEFVISSMLKKGHMKIKLC